MTPTSRPSDLRRTSWRGTGIYWSLVAGLVVAAGVIVGIVQNSQTVDDKYLLWAGQTSLAVILLATVVVTVALTALAGVAWRRRRRGQLARGAELTHLRGIAARSAAARGEDSASDPSGVRPHS